MAYRHSAADHPSDRALLALTGSLRGARWSDNLTARVAQMRLPTLTETERPFLKALDKDGPAVDIPQPLRGRLALYGLIAETPKGWTVTERGKEAIVHAPAKESPETPGTRPTVRSQVSGKRMPLRRKSPFDE